MKEKKENKKERKAKEKKIAKSKSIESTSTNKSNKCDDEKCPIHGKLSIRGRFFKGTVIKIFNQRVVIEFERLIYLKKYERFAKASTKLHAYLPKCMIGKINIGDIIKIGECRPLNKIVHFAVIEKIKEKKYKK